MSIRLSEMLINNEKVNFLEEELVCNSCTLSYTFYDKPQPISESIALKGGKKIRKVLGVAEGVFSVLDGTSRNNRFYPESFWRAVVLSEDIKKRVSSRRMLGTIGHYDKKIDTQDFAEGLISHVITDLYIDEENRVVRGRLEILDTPAGRLLKEYYESDLPMYVSSRGAGKTMPSYNSSIVTVNEKYYYLEGYDVVWDPGFWEAKPVYQNNEDLNEEKLNSSIYAENLKEELIMENAKLPEVEKYQIDAGMQEIFKQLLSPLQDSVNALSESVKGISEKVEKLEIQEEKQEDEKKDEEEKPEDKKDEKKEEMCEETDYKKIIKELQAKVVRLEEDANHVVPVSAENPEVSAEQMKEPEVESHDNLNAEVAMGDPENLEPKVSCEDAATEHPITSNPHEELESDNVELQVKVAQLEEEKRVNEEYKVKIKELVSNIKEDHKLLTSLAEEYANNKIELARITEELKKSHLEISARQIAEECGITIESARTRLQDKTVEQIKEDIEKEKEDEKKKEEEKEKEELKESVSESVEMKIKPLNRFVNESKEEIVKTSSRINKPVNRFINESKVETKQEISQINKPRNRFLK